MSAGGWNPPTTTTDVLHHCRHNNFLSIWLTASNYLIAGLLSFSLKGKFTPASVNSRRHKQALSAVSHTKITSKSGVRDTFAWHFDHVDSWKKSVFQPKIVNYVFETYLKETLYDKHFYHMLTAKTENWKSFIFSFYSPEEILWHWRCRWCTTILPSFLSFCTSFSVTLPFVPQP